MHESEIRRRVESLLLSEVGDDLWDYLTDRGFVEDVQLTEDLDSLAEEVRRIKRAVVRPKRAEPMFVADDAESTSGSERAWLLSRLVANHGHADAAVSAFRARHLPDGLIEWSSFDGWLRERLAAQGPITKDISAPLPSGTEIVRENGRVRLVPPLDELRGFEVKARTLDYALPGDTWTRRAVVVAGSELDQLRELSRSLSSSFAWQSAQASIFVVCGTIPFIAPVRISVSSVKTRDSYDVPWARRIKLDIDPAATPEEVVQAFREARSRMDLPHQRTMSAKHLRLAAFAGLDHDDLSWEKRYNLWNERFSHWAYTQQSNFRRDALRAQTRVLGFVV